MNSVITAIKAREILDSRGFPTVEAEVTLADGSVGKAAVPSGASTGKREALELRDGDVKRYGGKGVLKAVHNINSLISGSLLGVNAEDQFSIDSLMKEIDGFQDKRRLGANSTLAVSLATARSVSVSKKIPFYKYLAEIFGNPNPNILPVPQMNVLNGGAHADNNIDFQEFMILPIDRPSFGEALRSGAEIFQQLHLVLKDLGLPTGVGDEGGFAPNLESNQEALNLISSAVHASQYTLGEEIFIGIDVASSEFFHNNKYILSSENGEYTSDEFIDRLCELTNNYPIISLEDPLAEDDWGSWVKITKKIGSDVQLTGDDLFVTNSSILAKGVDMSAANSILVKPNQIGTLSETFEAVKLAQSEKYTVTVSHRSGETEDSAIADIAVAVGASQIKTGSLCRSERISKYNRLLWIERDLGDCAQYFGKAAFPNI